MAEVCTTSLDSCAPDGSNVALCKLRQGKASSNGCHVLLPRHSRTGSPPSVTCLASFRFPCRPSIRHFLGFRWRTTAIELLFGARYARDLGSKYKNQKRVSGPDGFTRTRQTPGDIVLTVQCFVWFACPKHRSWHSVHALSTTHKPCT